MILFRPITQKETISGPWYDGNFFILVRVAIGSRAYPESAGSEVGIHPGRGNHVNYICGIYQLPLSRATSIYLVYTTEHLRDKDLA